MDGLQPLSQAGHAPGQLGIRWIEVFERGFKIEDRGRHFHRQLRPWRLSGMCHCVDRVGQCAGQRRAGCIQLDQRLANLVELVGRALELTDFTSGQDRPELLGDTDALAGLGQQQWVETTELADQVIDRSEPVQRVGQAHARQGRRIGSVLRHYLGAEEKQILGQPVRCVQFALGQRRVLHQHPRRGPLDIKIRRQEAQRHGLKKTGAYLPENLRLAHGLVRSQSQAELGEFAGGGGVARLDHAQNGLVHLRSHGSVVGNGRCRRGCLRLGPAPVQRP